MSACQAQAYKEVDVATFNTLIKPDAQLVDFRTPEEFGSGALENAKNIDIYSGSFEADVKKLDTNTPVFLYCRSGQRSAQAANLLSSMGFKAVYSLKGGIGAWASEGKPLVKP